VRQTDGVDQAPNHPTNALIHLDRLAHNVAFLRQRAGGRPLWPAVKANAYGHGAVVVSRALADLGCNTLCVAHVSEAAVLRGAGIGGTVLVMSAALPDAAGEMVALGVEPAVCTDELVAALSAEARSQGRTAVVHVKVDTGMGRVGIAAADAPAFVARCAARPGVRVRGLMSHLPRADDADPSYSLEQTARFAAVCDAVGDLVEVRHMANSAGIFAVPGSLFDAVRPGIAVYGLPPSTSMKVPELRPVLEWHSRITFLKEVPTGTGLSYGHRYVTDRPALIATIPVGYGDGLSRALTNRMDVLVHGARCRQVGTVTMDQTLIDVTSLRGRVALGDEAVVIGRQGQEEITVAELADRLETITYEVTTAISARVPRQPVP